MTVIPHVFFNGDVPLAAHVHRDGSDLVSRQPAVLVTGSWLTVKEQMADHYARALAQHGFTAITFDFAGFGASGGTPRQAEIPERKIADIATVARQVSRLSFIQPGVVGHLAICASVAGWYHDTPTVAAFYGGIDGVTQRLERARTALEEYQRTGHSPAVPAYDSGNERAGMFFQLDYYASPDRGAVPSWSNEMAEMSWQYWLTFNGLSSAPKVTVPTLFVHSDDCVLPDNVRAVRDRLAGPSELVWSDGSQTDFYDQSRQVSEAVSAAVAHFGKTLVA